MSSLLSVLLFIVLHAIVLILFTSKSNGGIGVNVYDYVSIVSERTRIIVDVKEMQTLQGSAERSIARSTKSILL